MRTIGISSTADREMRSPWVRAGFQTSCHGDARCIIWKPARGRTDPFDIASPGIEPEPIAHPYYTRGDFLIPSPVRLITSKLNKKPKKDVDETRYFSS